jgi:hypothetical protein
MGLFSSPIPPGIVWRHPYRLRTRDHDGAVRMVCACGEASPWMASEAGAQFEADRHVATGSHTWDR